MKAFLWLFLFGSIGMAPVFLVAQDESPIPPDEDFQSKLDRFIEGLYANEIAKEQVTDFAFLNSKLALSEEGATEQLLVSFFRTEDMVKYIILEEIWRTVAEVKRFECALSASKFLAALEPPYVEGFVEIMISGDQPGESRAWDFRHYVPVLEANKEDPFERLIIYMFEMSTDVALRTMMSIYEEDLDSKKKSVILARASIISGYIRKYGSRFDFDHEVDEMLAFFADLQKYDSWYLDTYMVACLKAAYLTNVSKELNEYFESKPHSLANRFRKSEGRYGMDGIPPREIRLPDRSETADERDDILAESRAERTSRVKKDESDSVDAKSKQVEPEETLIEEDQRQWPYVLLAGAILGIALLLHRAWRRNRGSN